MSLAAFLLSAVLALSPQQVEVAARITADGQPECTLYLPDQTSLPCRPVITVIAGARVIGHSSGEVIRLTGAAVRRLNRDEFALLVAHEVAHYYLGHTASTPAAELAADRLGAALACRAGFSPAAGISVLRFAAAGRTHPRRDVRRMAILAAPCRVPAVTFAR